LAPSRTSLQRLFAPASVAVVGASTSPDKAGYQAVLALDGFPGEVFPINPKANEVLGRRAFASLGALARPVDLVLFAVPAPACLEAVREAIATGCGGGLIVSGGFAESGAAGRALQEELATLCAASTFRLLGPNTAGFINKAASLTASFVAGADHIPRGNVAVVAQSAGVNLTVSFLLAKLGYGVSLAVGLGNSIDVDAADVLEFLVEQPGTKAIALHLEGVARGRRLYEVVRRITPEKPVVVLTVGGQEVSAFAESHTGNLLGSYTLRRAALKQAGALLVDSTDELARAAAVLSRHRLSPKDEPGIGVLTAQAGPGLLMLERLKSEGVCVPTLREPTVRRIAGLLPPMTYLKNPVDTGRPGPSFAEVAAALADDEQIDAIAAYALHEPAALRASEVLPALARRVGKPILFGTAGPPADVSPTIDALRGEKIYVAESPEHLAQAAGVLARDAAARARLERIGEVAIASVGVELPRIRDEYSAKQLLVALGVPAPRGFACASHAEARAAWQTLGRSAVVKILAPEIQHKTEVFGVHANVTDEATLERALARLDAIPLTSPRRYLIEEMAPPGLELLLGAVRDESFGPTVTLGLGGTLAETFQDTVTRLAPITMTEAEEMLHELRAAPLFDGWRGSPELDRRAVQRALVAVGDFLCRHSDIKVFEINPLRVYPRGTLALDALLSC
jgi:acyl-CoA synthetase (NDP forming)